jgi:hypothetical protein
MKQIISSGAALLALSLALAGACSSGSENGNDGTGGAAGDGDGGGDGDGDGGAGGNGDGDGDGDNGDVVELTFDFNDGDQNFVAGFSDYSQSTDDLELDSGINTLPAELGEGTGFMLQGHNRSDDLFMYLSREIGFEEGLVPGQAYRIGFAVHLGSSAQAGCFGIGGAPAESVYFKVGAAPFEPTVSLEGDDYVINVDKSNQAQGGTQMSVAGDISNEVECGSEEELYREIEREHVHDTPVTADENGRLWLILGTDSGFEGLTRLYYLSVHVTLTPVDN